MNPSDIYPVLVISHRPQVDCYWDNEHEGTIESSTYFEMCRSYDCLIRHLIRLEKETENHWNPHHHTAYQSHTIQKLHQTSRKEFCHLIINMANVCNDDLPVECVEDLSCGIHFCGLSDYPRCTDEIKYQLQYDLNLAIESYRHELKEKERARLAQLAKEQKQRDDEKEKEYWRKIQKAYNRLKEKFEPYE